MQQCEHIFPHHSVRADMTEYLLGPRPWRLAGRALAKRTAIVFHELVGAVQIRRIAGSIHPRADAKAVDRRTALQQRLQCILVQVAAGDDVDVFTAPSIQDAANAACKRGQIAAVYAHGLDAYLLFLH